MNERPASGNDPDEVLLSFARAVRAAGVPVTHDRSATFLQAASRVGAGSAAGVRTAGRATLCSGPDDLERFDAVFEAWFGEELPRTRPSTATDERPPTLPEDTETTSGDDGDEIDHALASTREILRHRDVAELTHAEKARVHRMLETLDPRAPRRRARRRTSFRRGDVDPARTLRESLRRHGEPGRISWRHRGSRARRVVLLVDVSGSMSRYADTLLRLAHRFVASGGPVEVFTLGTRLTRVTPALRHHDTERALIAAGRVVPDWSGGTRLGETMRAFLDRWGQRGMARGAVVVVFSDGWERGDAMLLGEQAGRLHRLAHRVVWVNPHRGRPGYEPVQGGVVAVLPHVHDFVSGHSLATYRDLCEVIARA